MTRLATVLLCLALLVACSGDSPDGTVAQQPDASLERADAPDEATAADTVEPAPRPSARRAASATRAASASGTPPPFYGTSRRLPDSVREWMKGRSWRSGCPVLLRDLRLLRMSFWGFDGEVHRGPMVVHEDVAAD